MAIINLSNSDVLKRQLSEMNNTTQSPFVLFFTNFFALLILLQRLPLFYLCGILLSPPSITFASRDRFSRICFFFNIESA